MKLAILSVLALVTTALAVESSSNPVIVLYPDNTPDSVIDEAMSAIRAAGGIITHQYSLIRGFAANAPAKILETIQSLNAEYHATIELDQIISVNGASQ
ncbi:hypothetical protein QTJ16_006299 [Diplocarpon rosae]|uniref:Uncharacterized protein n=1 Tax=Diplocarpon rosae TaxID=946125 RepID=A0AAD9WD09_9HELO|nr:hypothetical protein QTJ16_006299 [Diplocarpon rosae]PBP27983.1 hypothetical protein BUE80_DR000989 [Diplocarpon rosae]